MSDYLLEIGLEELPAGFINSAMEQLKAGLKKLLDDEKISYENIKTFSTPRRLAVIIEDISLSQSDEEKEIKGPPAKIALDSDNNLTKAGEGFLKKNNLSKEAIKIKDIKGIDYIFADIFEQGKSTAEILSEKLPAVILKIQGARFMRWADLDEKFSRPIRWIVSIMDGEEVKIKVADVVSSNISRGHRFSTECHSELVSESGKIKITPQNYEKTLEKALVIVDPEKRKQTIMEQAKRLASSVGADAQLDEDLLDEVVNIVEYPVGILGEFNKDYLKVPKEVITTVMASHQKYFPVMKNGELLNYFIFFANYRGNEKNIKNGNERVLRARLEDAIFFYNEDTKRTLESRVDDLKGITFQKGLGSIYDKIERIKKLSAYIANELNLEPETKNKIQKTAELCKADLTTNMVFEFTELEGVIGSYYALKDGADREVAQGIKEHYLPNSADRILADSMTGQVVGIADKIDTICAVFLSGKIPTGSSDPLGARRAALGIVLTVIKKGLDIDISELIKNTLSRHPEFPQCHSEFPQCHSEFISESNTQQILKQVQDDNSLENFIIQRLKIYLSENYQHDIIESVLAVTNPLENLLDTMQRLEMVSKLVKEDNYKSFHEASNRIIRIVKESSAFEINPNLFKEIAEKELYMAIQEIKDDNYDVLLECLINSIPAIEKFFDDVLVMDKDEAIKNNRLALLNQLNNKFRQLADFSKIVY